MGWFDRGYDEDGDLDLAKTKDYEDRDFDFNFDHHQDEIESRRKRIFSLSFSLINQRCGDTKISRKVFQKESYNVLVREMWDCRMSLWLMGLLREIDSVIMNQREIKENCGSPRMRIWDQYKRKKGFYTWIIYLVTFSLAIDKDQSFILFLLAMTQSQLLSNVGEVKNGEGTRRRFQCPISIIQLSSRLFPKLLLEDV